MSHHGCYGVASLIRRNPISFAREEWLTRAQIGDELVQLLSRGRVELDKRELAELEAWFGPAGKFPAMKISE